MYYNSTFRTKDKHYEIYLELKPICFISIYNIYVFIIKRVEIKNIESDLKSDLSDEKIMDKPLESNSSEHTKFDSDP